MLKPEELIKDKWYYIESNEEFIFKFSHLNDRFINGSCFSHINGSMCNSSGAWYKGEYDLKELREATKEEVLKYFPNEKFDDIVSELIIGEIYKSKNTGNIFKWGGKNASHYLGHLTSGSLPNTAYRKNGGGFSIYGNIKASKEEKQWLEASILCNKFIEKDKAIKLMNIKQELDKYLLT